MDRSNSFVFYRSFSETAKLIEDDNDRLKLYEALIAFGLEGEKPELDFPLNAILEQMTASVRSAADRYSAAKENGVKGGRPSKRKFIPPSEWQAYLKDHSQRETAAFFGISERTLRNWIAAEKTKAEKTGKNLNYNVNDNDNLNDNDNSNYQYQIINNNKAESAETPKGVPPPRPTMPGYEFVHNGIRYRYNGKREVEDLGPA